MEINQLTAEQVKQIVVKILEEHTHLKKVEERFEAEGYADYRDGFENSSLIEISQADDKMGCFHTLLEETVTQAGDYEMDEITKIVKNHWDKSNGEYEDYEDIIFDYLREIIDYLFPYEHYLNQNVYVNVLVETGDGNYDFTLNNFASYNAAKDEEIEEESSILWLVKQQGYTKEQLIKAVRERDYQNSPFLESIVDECNNVTSHMNALSFFVQMSLGDFIDLLDSQKTLVLAKNTSCGLYDCWNGAGGTLEIALEKEVEIPFEYNQAHVDGARGYGIDSIYGMSRSFWTDSVIELKETTKKETE